MTNFELAQQLVRLGAVTASALDSGTSTTMAFDGKLLNRPSDPGGERGIADGLFVFYYGVQVPAPHGRRRLAERRRRRRGAAAHLQGRPPLDGHGEPDRPGRSRPPNPDRPARTRHLHTRLGRAAPHKALPSRKGAGAGSVDALDDRGQQSHAERAFYLNNTLGYLRVSPSRIVLRRRGGALRVAFRLAHPATVTLKISTVSGATVQTVRRRLRAGTTRHPLERALRKRHPRLLGARTWQA
jgi:hypothetical protein